MHESYKRWGGSEEAGDGRLSEAEGVGMLMVNVEGPGAEGAGSEWVGISLSKVVFMPSFVFAHGRVKMTLPPMASQNVHDEHGGAAHGSAYMYM